MSEDPGSSQRAELLRTSTELSVIEKSAKWASLKPGLEDRFPRAIEAALTATGCPGDGGEVTLILADDTFQQELNRTYRGVDKSTNVLAFADLADQEVAPPGGPIILGDIVLAYETCAREAEEQGKALPDHAMHLAVHGLLHLLGFDHDTDESAAAMESLERSLLAPFGIADPYCDQDDRPSTPGARETESSVHG